MNDLSALLFTHIWDAVTLLSLILSFLSLYLSGRGIKLALQQGAESHEQSARSEKLFREQAELICRLEGLVSTRTIGIFPEYLPKVADLLKTAKTSIRIMTLISSHGSYTEEEKWLEVKQAIEQQGVIREKLKSRFVLELITTTPDTFKETFKHIHTVFRTTQDWEKWKFDEEQYHDNRLSRFLKKCRFHKGVEGLSVDDYYEARLKEHQDVLEDVFRNRGYSIYPSKLSLPLYCWLVDEREAIFSIPTQDNSGRYAGVGISTEEKNVVAALLRLFEHYRLVSQSSTQSQPS